MKKLILMLLLSSVAYSSQTSQYADNITSMLKQQLEVKKEKKISKKNKTKSTINYPEWLTKSYQANN
jgi:hypothetical protein